MSPSQWCCWRIKSFGMLHHVDWKIITNVSKDDNLCTAWPWWPFETSVTVYQSVQHNIPEDLSHRVSVNFYTGNHTIMLLSVNLFSNHQAHLKGLYTILSCLTILFGCMGNVVSSDVMIVSDELGMMWKKIVLAYFAIIFTWRDWGKHQKTSVRMEVLRGDVRT